MVFQAVTSAEADRSVVGVAPDALGYRLVEPAEHEATVGVGFGVYRFVRELGPHPLGERWLALDPRSGASCTVYRLTAFRGGQAGRRALEALKRLANVRHPHLLPIRQFGMDALQTPCVVTDYTGHHDGLVTLEQLVRVKGGSLSAPEAARAVAQVTEACAAAHAEGIVHGRFGAEDVLVDRFGQLWIELYGLAHLLRRANGEAEASAAADEARSVVALGRVLFLGRGDGIDVREARRRGVPRRWVSWLSRGTGVIPPFVSIEQAAAALPTREPPTLCRDCPCTWRDWLKRLGEAVGRWSSPVAD